MINFLGQIVKKTSELNLQTIDPSEFKQENILSGYKNRFLMPEKLSNRISKNNE